MTQFDRLMDKILAHFAGEDFKVELSKAKKDFFDGPLDEENSDSFDLRMCQFFDWYFYTRELSGYGQTPLEVCHLVRELRFSDEEVVSIEEMKKHRHSIFEFLKIKGDDVYLKDLLRNEKIIVRKSSIIYGFNEDELFDVRLVPFEGSFVFTKGFCFHPADAKKYILSEIKRHRKDPDLDPELLILKLIRMRFQFERYRHVKPELIYSSNNKINRSVPCP